METSHTAQHLWETEHPYYGAEGNHTNVESFAELRETIDAHNENQNHVYRWDWQAIDEYNDTESFTVFCVLPRKSRCWSVSCPINGEQESEVLDWLRGPRVLGALRTMWAPLLDGFNTGPQQTQGAEQ